MHILPFPLIPRPGWPVRLVPLLAAAALCGCASVHRFDVDAVRAAALRGHGAAYRLVASEAMARAPEGRALAAQVLEDVRTALSSHGMFEAPAGVAAAVEVEVDCGIGGVETRVLTHREPVYVAGSGGGGAGREGRGGGGLPVKIGEREVRRVVTVFPAFLRITARPVDAAGDGVVRSAEAWSVYVTHEHESGDVRRAARLMVAAAMDLIGRDTPQGREVVLTGADERVAFVERGREG